jgi:hypothetical protein
MTAYTWKTATSGTFETAANWTPTGGPPGAADDALLTVAGAAYTVTTTATDTVNDIQTASNATLSIANSQNFTATTGTGSGANAGQIIVGNNSYLFLGGTFNNTSTVSTGGILLNGAANATELRVLGANLNLTGGGSVVLGTAGNNYIVGNNGAATTLTNVNNTISGVGNIGNGGLTLVNETAGTINANQTAALTLNVNGGVTNTGLLEATSTGGLNVLSTGITNQGGVIEATGSGAHVDLQNSTVAGGALTSTSGAQIDLINSQNATIDGSSPAGALTITTGTNVNVDNNSYLYAYGSIVNDGTISLLSGASATELRVGTTATPATTFTGGGNIVLGGAGNAYIVGDNGAASSLVNVNNTISGDGNIGNGGLTLTNDTAGLINANQTTALTIDANGGVYNTGTLEATNTGGLIIDATGVDNEGGVNAGKISATTSGAHVDLTAGSIIYGGTLSAVAGAQFDVAANQNGYLDGQDPGSPINITSGTTFNVNNNAALFLYGVINNQGVININGTANDTELRITSPIVTLSGAGHVNLASGPAFIFGVGGGADELDNINNTIAGEGTLGNGDLTLRNEAAGVVDANQTTSLTLNPNDGTYNLGLLEDTGTGGLALSAGFIDNTQSANSGKISATGAGAHIDLSSSVAIYGGTLSAGSGAYLDVAANQNAYFYGTYAGSPVNITTGTTLDVDNNAALFLAGTINNSGTINIGVVPADPNNTELRLNSAVVTLTTTTPTATGGTIQLSNSANNYIFGDSGSTQTLNDVNNVIQGSGDIGNGDMTLILGKKAVINANQGPNGTGQPGLLELNPNGGVTNGNIIESSVAAGASAGGTLLISNTTINNGTAGKIEANGIKVGATQVGSLVELQAATIIGGSLLQTAANPSQFQIVAGQTVTLDGVPEKLTDSATINEENNATLNLQGAIVITKGKGAINVLSAANNTFLNVAYTTVTLTGGGAITLGGTGNNYIQSNNGDQSLINTSDTIQGVGNIGNGGGLEIYNSALIDANSTAGALTLQVGPMVENNGTIEATGGGRLFILNSNIDNTYATTAGVLNTGKIIATGSSFVDLQNANIYGGTLTATGAAYIDVVSGQAVGLNGTVQGQAVNISAGTNFDINDNATLYTYGTINNIGTINIEGAADATYLRLNSSVTTLTGGGNLVLGGTGNNYVVENQGNCELDNVNNTISGSGNIGNGGQLYLTNESGGTIDALAGGLTINLGGVATNNFGTLEATTGALSVTYAVFNTGSIIANGSNVTIAGNVDGAGAIELFGASNVEIGSSYGAAAAQVVTFKTGATGIFKIDTAQDFTGTIQGFGPHGTIDLANIAYSTASYKYNATTGLLTVTDNSIVANIQLAAGGVSGDFALSNDGNGHTDVTYSGSTPLVAPTSTSAVGQFASALAGFGAPAAGSASGLASAGHNTATLLAVPRAA